MPDAFDLIFIVVDTLRYDYSISLKRTFTKLGFVFYDNVISPASWTLPTHVSILTGLYPGVHNVHETKTKKHLDLRVSQFLLDLMINNILEEKGYLTYLISANPFISPSFGFINFNNYYNTFGINGILSYTSNNFLENAHVKSRIDYITKPLLSKKVDVFLEVLFKFPLYLCYKQMLWPLDKGSIFAIKKLKNITSANTLENKFIFINLMEVHEPYYKKEGDIDNNFIVNLKTGYLNKSLVQKWKKNYPKEVMYINKRLIDIMKILKKKGVFDNSLIIITSDHGQLLGEHGRISHGTFLYDELLRVPLLIKYPKDYEVEHLLDESKYISLVKLKSFILNVLNNKLNDDSFLYSDTVFAESYGVHTNIGRISNERERNNIEQLEKYRIAIYYKNFKGIFNVTDWKFETIKSYNPQEKVTENIVKEMKKEVIRFLRTVTATKVSGIKF